MKYDFFEIEKKLEGYAWFVWLCFGDRSYPRNIVNIGLSLSTGLAYVFLTLSFIFYHILPNEWFSVFYVFLALLITILCTIESASEYVIETFVLILIGGEFWFCNPQFGFELNGYQYESIFFAVMLAGGCIAALRRAWNAIIYRLLDDIVINLEGE